MIVPEVAERACISNAFRVQLARELVHKQKMHSFPQCLANFMSKSFGPVSTCPGATGQVNEHMLTAIESVDVIGELDRLFDGIAC